MATLKWMRACWDEDVVEGRETAGVSWQATPTASSPASRPLLGQRNHPIVLQHVCRVAERFLDVLSGEMGVALQDVGARRPRCEQAPGGTPGHSRCACTRHSLLIRHLRLRDRRLALPSRLDSAEFESGRASRQPRHGSRPGEAPAENGRRPLQPHPAATPIARPGRVETSMSCWMAAR